MSDQIPPSVPPVGPQPTPAQPPTMLPPTPYAPVPPVPPSQGNAGGYNKGLVIGLLAGGGALIVVLLLVVAGLVVAGRSSDPDDGFSLRSSESSSSRSGGGNDTTSDTHSTSEWEFVLDQFWSSISFSEQSEICSGVDLLGSNEAASIVVDTVRDEMGGDAPSVSQVARWLEREC